MPDFSFIRYPHSHVFYDNSVALPRRPEFQGAIVKLDLACLIYLSIAK